MENTVWTLRFLWCRSVYVALFVFSFLLLQTLFVSHPNTLTCGTLRHCTTAVAFTLLGTVPAFFSGVYFSGIAEFQMAIQMIGMIQIKMIGHVSTILSVLYK